MPVEKVAVGEHLFVFTNKSGINLDAWGANPNCIIDSHGFRPPHKPYFKMRQGQTIHFYVNRHAFLCVGEVPKQDGMYRVVESVEQIANDQVQPVETFRAGDRCPDYWLDKQVKSYNNKHSDRYDHIGYDDLLIYLRRNPDVANRFDLISIRHRPFRQASLSQALDSLAKRGYAYATIHCSFCRGGTLDALAGQGWNEEAGGRLYLG